MRVFDHPNLSDFKCPICGTSEDKPVVLIGIVGTQKGGIQEAEQFHLDCVDRIYYPGIKGNASYPPLIAQSWFEFLSGEKETPENITASGATSKGDR